MKRAGKKRGRSVRKPYPTNRDIIEALTDVVYAKPYLHPDDFVEEVRRELESRGFFTGLVSARRVWRCYERMVKSGRMPDLLNVVSVGDEALDGPEELSS
ncbi:MAG: hypothetical protein QXP94_03915 [Thermofilaceae archaeon]